MRYSIKNPTNNGAQKLGNSIGGFIGDLFGGNSGTYAQARDEAFNNNLKGYRDFTAAQLNQEKINDSRANREFFQQGINSSFNFAPKNQVQAAQTYKTTGSFPQESFSDNTLTNIRNLDPRVFGGGQSANVSGGLGDRFISSPTPNVRTASLDPNTPLGKLFLKQPEPGTPESVVPSGKISSPADILFTNHKNVRSGVAPLTSNISATKNNQNKEAFDRMRHIFGDEAFTKIIAAQPDERLGIAANTLGAPKFFTPDFEKKLQTAEDRKSLALMSRYGDLSGMASLKRAENPPTLPKSAQDALALNFFAGVDPNKPETVQAAIDQYTKFTQNPNQGPEVRTASEVLNQFTQPTQQNVLINPSADTEGQSFSQDPLGYTQALAGQGVDVLLDKIDAVSDYFSNSGITPDPSQQEAFNGLINEAIRQGVPLELRGGQIMVGNKFLDDYLKDQIQNVETQTGQPEKDIRDRFADLQKEGVIPNSSDGLANLQVGEQRPFTRNGQPGVVSKDAGGVLIFKANGSDKWIKLR